MRIALISPVALLFAMLLPGSAHALTVVSTIGSNPSSTCASASTLTFAAGNVSYFCNSDGLTHTCSGANLTYAVDTATVNLTCTSGVVIGQIVDALVDGLQNGDGTAVFTPAPVAGNQCLAATNLSFNQVIDSQTQRVIGTTINWTCGTSALSCYPLGSAQFDLVQNKVTVVCSMTNPQLFYDDFE